MTRNVPGCHKLATHDAAGNIDLAGLGAKIVTKIEGGHMGKSLPTQELSALADFADTFTPPAPPVVPRSSQAVYDENCSGCHKLNGYDAAGNIDLAGMGSVAATKVPSGHGGSVSTAELTNLAAWLDSWAPVPPPVVARDGQAVYDSNCAGCHKLYGYDAAGNHRSRQHGQHRHHQAGHRPRWHGEQRRSDQPGRLARQLDSGPAAGGGSQR